MNPPSYRDWVRVTGPTNADGLSRFAEAGDPNGDGALAWPKFMTAGDQRLQFETGTEHVVTSYRSAECALWRTFYASFDPGRPGSGDVTL